MKKTVRLFFPGSWKILAIGLLMCFPSRSPANSASSVRWRLLSDNSHYRGPAKSTGATYQWESPATNPGDQSGRRLLDGDRPYNWKTTTGWNHHDNAVVFDFQQPYRFTRAELHFHKAIPEFVEVQIPTPPDATSPNDWTPVARIENPTNGWNTVSIPDAPLARHPHFLSRLVHP